MRFEIKTGGIAAILVGVAALSFAVFLLGLLAGYDVGRESQTSAAQVATAYPVGAPPDSATNSVPAPAAVPSPARQVAAAAAPTPMPVKVTAPVAPDAPIAPVASAGTATPKHSKPAARATPSDDDDDYPEPTEAPPPSGRVTTPTRRAAAENDTDDTSDNDAEVDAPAPVRTPRAASTEVASARPPQSAPSQTQPRHKPYNIQIEAAMDSNSANQMSQRLRALGYQSHLVPAHLNGQTWYKIVIGPYPTQEAASAAQTEMRAKYNSAYGSRTANASGTSN